MDWIEIAIKRIERAIKQLDNQATNVYKTWSTRNENLRKQMEKVTEEIDLQKRAYDRYIQEANSVGLSEEYAEKVRNGTIDIEKITDKDLNEQIKDFKEFYEKALECQDAVDELDEKLSKLYKNEFDNVSKKFEGLLNIIEYYDKMLNSYISQSKESGYIVSIHYYEALLENEKKNLSQLENKREEMLEALADAVSSGQIKEESEAYYDMIDDVNKVTIAIEKANESMIEFNNSIREIKWDIFDLIQDRITNIANEADFLIKLMKNDNLYDDRGQLTDEGMATMGLHATDFNIYMHQANRYAEEIKNIEKDLAKDSYNQDLVERRQKLIELQQDMILNAESEKDAIKDLVSEGIEKELDSLQKLIDKYKKALDVESDLYDYTKKVQKQTKELTSLQKQLASYSNDASEEAKVKVQKLTVSLEDAKQELEETQYNKYISDQKKLLDDLYDDYEKVLNQRLDDLESLVSDMIVTVNNNASSINDTITTQATSVGYTLSTAMQDIWNGSTGMSQIVATYGDKMFISLTSISSVLNYISADVASMIGQLNKVAKTKVQDAKTKEATEELKRKLAEREKNKKKEAPTTNNNKYNDEVKQGVAAAIWAYGGNGSGWGDGTERSKKLTEKFGSVNAKAIQDYINAHAYNGDLYRYWVEKKDLSKFYYSAFKKGAFNINKDQLAWTQENGIGEAIIRPSDGAILTPLKSGDSVLNGHATANLYEMMNNPSDFIRNNLFDSNVIDSVPSISNTTSPTSVNLENMNFNLPNVKNYEEFLYAMQHDRKFEKLVRAMTVDRAFGGSSLKKYRV